MRFAGLGGSSALALLCASAANAQGGAPLDVTDPMTRVVFVEFENSSNLGVVGQSFGPPFPATWSVTGNTGIVALSAETHEESYGTMPWPPVPNGFTSFLIHIDLTTLEATSLPATAAWDSGSTSLRWDYHPLDTTATGGFIGPNIGPLFCTSQQQAEDFCQVLPFPPPCLLTCTLVPGSPYDPVTGRVNLIGIREESGCDGPCSGPFPHFTGRGDLRLTEGPGAPALPGLATGALFALLAASAFALRAGSRGVAR